MTIIVTGHGEFATGLRSSLKLITGMEKAVIAVDFTEGMSSDDLFDTLSSIRESSDDEVLLFADIPGGTPFNQSVLLKSKYDGIEIIAGTNLPILIEAVLTSEPLESEKIKEFIETGKDGILHYTGAIDRSTKNNNEDGI